MVRMPHGPGKSSLRLVRTAAAGKFSTAYRLASKLLGLGLGFMR